jgi:hypothetical protein
MTAVLFWDFTQRIMVISQRRFGTICKGEAVSASPLQMGPIGSHRSVGRKAVLGLLDP